MKYLLLLLCCVGVSAPSSFAADRKSTAGLIECVKEHDDACLNISPPPYASPDVSSKRLGVLEADMSRVEIGYEIYALAVEEVLDDGLWYKISEGWLRAQDLSLGSKARYQSWLANMQEIWDSSIFYASDSVTILAEPKESAQILAVIHDPSIIDFEGIETRGHWGKAKLYNFGLLCEGGSFGDSYEPTTGWVKLVRSDGMQNFMPYSRGC